MQVAWYKEWGYILCVFMCLCKPMCRLPDTRSGVIYSVCLYVCVNLCVGCLVQGVGLHTGRVYVCRLPDTRSGVTYWACLCVQVAWYKERGYILGMFVCAGCLVQGAGLHTVCVYVCRLPDTRRGVTYWACFCVQVAGYKVRGYILGVFMCAGCLVQGVGLRTGCVYVCRLLGTRSKAVHLNLLLCRRVAWCFGTLESFMTPVCPSVAVLIQTDGALSLLSA